MISAKVETLGLMQVPYDSVHYLNALAPPHLPRLLKAIEPDAHEVKLCPVPDAAEETHVLNIRGAVAGCVPFDALYDVTYPLEPRPQVKVELTSFANKDLSVAGKIDRLRRIGQLTETFDQRRTDCFAYHCRNLLGVMKSSQSCHILLAE